MLRPLSVLFHWLLWGLLLAYSNLLPCGDARYVRAATHGESTYAASQTLCRRASNIVLAILTNHATVHPELTPLAKDRHIHQLAETVDCTLSLSLCSLCMPLMQNTLRTFRGWHRTHRFYLQGSAGGLNSPAALLIMMLHFKIWHSSRWKPKPLKRVFIRLP